MTDHDTNRRCNTYCSDTLFGAFGAVHESLLFSNNGEIEVLPALPSDWKSGSIKGLMARTRVEVKELNWNIESRIVKVKLVSIADRNEIRLSAGMPWEKAIADGCELKFLHDEKGDYLSLLMDAGREVEVVFTLPEMNGKKR
ncbi:hypothetical protein GE107_10365 [Cohnella sp. CFH 77786]|uniref:glycoside hydrolase family 95-like protein n=1 Tax=Cohnella sp. CFH 77786 TaxID=2662265 RepID=UPI001C60F969|nr:hypothetical protein [Cohnella sp. CFH 77786]MBW5446464.1 hypothetical protein [Cohnella sp. CFH 77786]